MNLIHLFWLLVAGHCLVDTSLQTESIIERKNHNCEDTWVIWLTHHAMVQGLIVTAIVYFITKDFTLSVNLGIVETILHWAIDFGKCDYRYGIIMDQFLHILTKIIYIIIIRNAA